jgi:hypothetical protein
MKPNNPEPPEPLRVVEVIESQVGQPRNDGTPGSGLYKVPLRLNRPATDLEARLIERSWDSPPRYTTMHRPGICSVYGDTVALNGTTLSELKQYHLKTMNGVLELVNREAAELQAREQVRRGREEQQREQARREQRQQIEDINETLDSD